MHTRWRARKPMASWSIHENKEVTSKYQILGHIGSGSYADVYRGLRKADDLQVALKEVHDYQSACREIQALLRLRGHPNVVQLLDYLWLSDDSVVLVLEFLVSDLTVVIHRIRKQQQPKAISHLLDPQGIQYMLSDAEARTQLWASGAPDGSNNSFHVESYRTAPTSYDVYNTEAAHMLATDDAFETDAPSRNIVAAVSKACSHQEASDAAIEVATRVNEIAATIGDVGVTSNDVTGRTLDVETSAPSITVAKSSTAGNANDMEAAPAEGQQQDILPATFDSAEAEIKGWMIQLLRGVASCHSVGVLHRDLKPSNMLISTSGILKVADFGQARILEPPLCHVEECSLPCVTNVDDVSRPEAPESREDQSRIVSTIATFHTETMDKSMEVEDIDTASQPLFIKGFAKRQSHENLLHVNPSGEEINISKPLPDSETPVPEHVTDEDVRTIIGATNSKGTEGTVDSFVRDVHLDDFKIIGKALPIRGAIDRKTCIPQQCDGSADGVEDRHSFGSADEDDPRQVVWIDSDADSMWIHRDLTRPEWDVGGNYNDVPWGIDEAVSERSTEFSGSESALNKGDVGSEFTGCVGTRWYRAPELLYGATCYGMGVDMWAVGCIFGELLLGQPIFPGCSDIDQLSRIVRALGNPNEECWPGVSNLPDYGKILFADDRSFSLQQHIKQGSDEAHDLLKRLVCYDPGSRLNADDALKHPFFHVQPFPTPVSELRVPSPGPVDDDDEDAMHSF